jgi:hypothetical protein
MIEMGDSPPEGYSGGSVLQTPSVEIPMIKMQGGGQDVYKQPNPLLILDEMKGGGPEENVVALLAAILAIHPGVENATAEVKRVLSDVIVSTEQSGEEVAKVHKGDKDDYYTKVLSPYEYKWRVRVFPEDPDGINDEKIKEFLNPNKDTFKFDELKLFQKLLFTEPDVLTFLRSKPEEFIKFWRTYIEFDGTSVITLQTDEAGKRIIKFLKKIHEAHLKYNLYNAMALLRPYEKKKIEEKYGKLTTPFKLPAMSNISAILQEPKKDPVTFPTVEKINQEYTDEQHEKQMKDIEDAIKKFKDVNNNGIIEGEIRKAEQIGDYSMFETEYDNLKKLLDDTLKNIKSELDAHISKIDKQISSNEGESGPLEKYVKSLKVSNLKEIKVKYDKYLGEISKKMAEITQLIKQGKEKYISVKKELENVNNKLEIKEKESKEGDVSLASVEGSPINDPNTFIKNKFLLIQQENDNITKLQKIISDIFTPLFSANNTWDKVRKIFCEQSTTKAKERCNQNFFIYLKPSKNQFSTLEKVISGMKQASIDTILNKLLLINEYKQEPYKTQLLSLFEKFDAESKESFKQLYDEQPASGGRRRRSPDRKKPGKRVTRRH